MSTNSFTNLGFTQQSIATNNLTPQQTAYLKGIEHRKNKVEAILNDNSPLMTHFGYESDKLGAHNHNRQLELQIEDFAQNNPDGVELLDRFKKVAGKCPDFNTVKLVPVQGLSGLRKRIKTCTDAHEKVQNYLKGIESESKVLKENAIHMKKQVEEIKNRHAKLTHRWLLIVNLIESASISTGVFENNIQNSQNISILSNNLENNFKWAEWQQTLKVLWSQLNSILKSNSNSISQLPQLDENKANSFYKILNLEAEAISSLGTESINLEKDIKNIEEALLNGSVMGIENGNKQF